MILVLFIISILFANQNYDLQTARQTYYKATENEDFLESAINDFQNISKKYSDKKPLSMIYIGSLKALKAKYAFWPNDKLKFANEGIDILDNWIDKNQNDIEALFIYGTTYYYMPFFFNKSAEAEKALKRILELESYYSQVDQKLLKNALKFISDNLDLNSKEKQKIKKYLN